MKQHAYWLRRAAAALLCLGLLAGAVGCQEKEAPVSSAPQATAAPTPEPTPAPTPEPTPTPTAEPTATPAPTPAGDFEALFQENPIDSLFEESMSLATSFTTMEQACDTAAQRWQQVIDRAYQQAQGALSGEELTALEEEQSQWEGSLDGQVEELRAQTGDSPDGAVTVARQIVELYRQRAKALCQTAYEATGEMPSFQSEDPVG